MSAPSAGLRDTPLPREAPVPPTWPALRGVHLLRRARELGPRWTAARAAAALRTALLRRLPDVRLLHTARVVRERTGKSLLAQAQEIAALRRGPGRLRPFDYYAYELYDDRRYTAREKQDFAGWHGEERHRFLWRINDPGWATLCDDKLLTYGLLRGLGLPFPELYAVYHPGGRTFGDTPILRTPEALAEFLRRDMRYPFFGKPVADAFGRGASSVLRIDRERDVLVLSGGAEIAVEEYVRRFPATHFARHKAAAATPPAGYLFQERIVQHPLVERLSGGRVSSLRLVVLLTPDGPHLFRATWKLPVGDNITDHAIGVSGNVKCWVDPATGRVEHVLRGRRRATPIYALGHHGEPVTEHPDTRERLLGAQLPDWDRLVACCLSAAAALPGLRYQSWDFVLGASGPLALELNSQGGIAQMPGARGFNDSDFRRFFAAAVT